MSAWQFLGLGILFEVIGTSSMKMSNGFAEPWPTTVCIIGFILALFMLSQSVKTLDISVVYAVWSGAGIALITLIGMFFFGERITSLRLFFILLIITGVVGLQVSNKFVSEPINSNQRS